MLTRFVHQRLFILAYAFGRPTPHDLSNLYSRKAGGVEAFNEIECFVVAMGNPISIHAGEPLAGISRLLFYAYHFQFMETRLKIFTVMYRVRWRIREVHMQSARSV